MHNGDPTDDWDDDLDGDLELYLDAYRATERSTDAARSKTRAAVSERARPKGPGWSLVWVAVAAAVVATVFLGRGWGVLTNEANSVPSQAGYEQDPVKDAEVVAGDNAPTLRAPTLRAPVDPVPAEPTSSELRAPELRAPAPLSTASSVADPDSRRSATNPRTPRTPKASQPSASELAEETALFGEIQAALVGGKSTAAMAAIARHEKKFPRGVFRGERQVAKARALCRLGRTNSARKLRDTFLKRNPRSHLSARMRSVCVD